MKNGAISIIADGHEFEFSHSDPTGAWYDLDGVSAKCEGWQLTINADREVYARLVTPDGIVHYGTIGDKEDEVLADNFPFRSGDRYRFYEKLETETRYV